jgi:hypothetical protein
VAVPVEALTVMGAVADKPVTPVLDNVPEDNPNPDPSVISFNCPLVSVPKFLLQYLP